MPTSLPAPSDVRQAFQEELHPARQTALVGWLAFTGTFGVVRGITYSIKNGDGPLRDMTVGGLHIHHYMWGILTVSSVGAVALRGSDRLRRHPAMATAYGIGLALIVDEFALLLDLRDVYWAQQGRVSVDLAVGMIATAGSLLVGRPMFQRLQRSRRGAAAHA